MSGITKRTVFFDDSKGYTKFLDWALVMTDLGPMWEPFQFRKFAMGNAADVATDMMAKVDEIKPMLEDKFHQIMSNDSGAALMGGKLFPKRA